MVYFKPFLYAIIIPIIVLYCLAFIASKIFYWDYESQTPGLYERVYPNETHGFDLSHHNKNVKWDKLTNAQFVYLKATEGTWFKDPKFNTYRNSAKKHNIKVGAYHFMRPNRTGKQQFNYFKTVVGDNIDLIPVLDIEVPGISNKDIKEFIAECEKHYGVKPMIYANQKYYIKHSNAIKDCKWWMAHYRPSKQQNYAIWQFTDKKRIGGQMVDHNYINSKYTIHDFILKNH